ncbi:Bax inhibitor-1/YccA family protein [Prevotella sp. E15-22]|uniref:Bax inhibitor-1/YccA family protein n=1 Tax=Prevotella sp. E15-22 TaxID=2937774 RepID=UPI00204ABA36|nr:Bax inhibitor-1/YccA family protein [Prevotella sp. E15-22]UPS43725.1 Bax inhibitor-1/YccA family protein [Prevotella sp. E15-22]
MDYEEMNYQSFSRDRQLEASYAFPALMRKTYLWMSMALVITGLTAYVVATNAAISNFLFMHSQLIWILFLAEIGLVIGLSAAIRKISLSAATLMFVAYAALNGVTFSSLFYVYTMGSLASTFFITAGTFGAMSLVGFFTKADLSSMGKILLMALIGLIIASVVNIFVASSGLEVLMTYLGVLIFVGLTAYDTQKIKQMFLMAPDASEATQKYAVLGALTLYLDFINLFLYLLRIFGRRE